MHSLHGKDHEVISSSSNKTIKSIKALQMKKYRDKNGLFILEGKRPVDEAMKSSFIIELLVISEANTGLNEKYKQKATENKIPVLIVSEYVFSTISDTKSPQGVMAIVGKKQYCIDDALVGPSGFIVVLDGIKDPGNLGTIIRTADAAGVDGIVLVNDCVEAYNPKVIRATMGSILRVPVYTGYKDLELIEKLKTAGYYIAVSHLNGNDLYTWDGGDKKTALVIGSEDFGVSPQVAQEADSLIKIPIPGGAESLNASVAAGILIYEIYRKGIKMDKQPLE